jgi:hypothetical protein
MSWTNHSTAVQNTHAPILSSIRVSLLEMNKKRKTDQQKIQVAVCVCVLHLAYYIRFAIR